jgi:hypothetical protein
MAQGIKAVSIAEREKQRRLPGVIRQVARKPAIISPNSRILMSPGRTGQRSSSGRFRTQ